MENVVKIQVYFGYNLLCPYKGYEAGHGKTADVDISNGKTWEEALAQDFFIPLDSDKFVVQSNRTATEKKHSLHEPVIDLLPECRYLEKEGMYRMYAIYKKNFKQKYISKPKGAGAKGSKGMIKGTGRGKAQTPNCSIRLHSVRSLNSNFLASNRSPEAENESDSSSEPEPQHEILLNPEHINRYYTENEDDDAESGPSQSPQYQARKLVPTASTSRMAQGRSSNIRVKEETSLAIPDLRDEIKDRVENFGRRNLLQIREELLGVMKKEGQYSKWGLVAPSATFFLEQVFQLRGQQKM